MEQKNNIKVKKEINDIAVLIPNLTGKVLMLNFLSPSISAISFTISLTRVRPNANSAGTINGVIFSKTIPAYIKDNPSINATMTLPTNG